MTKTRQNERACDLIQIFYSILFIIKKNRADTCVILYGGHSLKGNRENMAIHTWEDHARSRRLSLLLVTKGSVCRAKVSGLKAELPHSTLRRPIFFSECILNVFTLSRPPNKNGELCLANVGIQLSFITLQVVVVFHDPLELVVEQQGRFRNILWSKVQYMTSHIYSIFQ